MPLCDQFNHGKESANSHQASCSGSNQIERIPNWVGIFWWLIAARPGTLRMLKRIARHVGFFERYARSGRCVTTIFSTRKMCAMGPERFLKKGVALEM